MVALISALVDALVAIISLWGAYIGIFLFIKNDSLLRTVANDRSLVINSPERRRAFTSSFLSRYFEVDASIFGSRLFSKKALAKSFIISAFITALSLSLLILAPTEHPLTPVTLTTPFLSVHAIPVLACAILSTFVIDFLSLVKSRTILRFLAQRPIFLFNWRLQRSAAIGDQAQIPSRHVHIPSWKAFVTFTADIILTILLFVLGFSILTRILIGFVSLFLDGLYIDEFVSSFSHISSEYSWGIKYFSGEFTQIHSILFLETPDGRPIWPTIRLFTFLSYTLWPVFFLSTFTTLILVSAFTLTNLVVRVLVVNSALIGRFLKRRVEKPKLVFRDCAILSLIMIVWAIVRGINAANQLT